MHMQAMFHPPGGTGPESGLLLVGSTKENALGANLSWVGCGIGPAGQSEHAESDFPARASCS